MSQPGQSRPTSHSEEQGVHSPSAPTQQLQGHSEQRLAEFAERVRG